MDMVCSPRGRTILAIAKKINGANNRELFELENEDIEDLKSTMNSLESKLNN
tara:strand:- start:333 stop:488 length:156 start_codon:yes stop_codon:yes gene_type:complete